MPLRALEPTHTAGLFRGLADELVSLLSSLEPPEWELPTLAGSWRVRDVAAHLLDGELRRLSLHRDRTTPPAPAAGLRDDRELQAWLDALNASWVEAARRLSPRVITRLLSVTGPELASFFEGLDPFGPAPFPVTWAGEIASLNWMDVGREYTERWHHQQQIREASGRPGLVEPRWLRPVIEISLRALPHAFRRLEAQPGATLELRIERASGGEWTLVREAERWRLGLGSPAPGTASARVTLSEDTAWRVFFKALARQEALERVRIEGDTRLGHAFVTTRAVMVPEE